MPIGSDWVAVGSCLGAGLSEGGVGWFRSSCWADIQAAVGRFRVDFEWAWGRLELICVRCAAGLASRFRVALGCG